MDAQPQPKFTWFFEDEPIVPGEAASHRTEIIQMEKQRSSLILGKPSLSLSLPGSSRMSRLFQVRQPVIE